MKCSKRLFAVVSVIFTVLVSLSQGILNILPVAASSRRKSSRTRAALFARA
jgi:hypothetical protein